MSDSPEFLFCDCATDGILPKEHRREVLDLLKTSASKVFAVHDLCGSVARRDPRLIEFLGAGSLVVVACRPRAVRSLLSHLDIPLESKSLTIVDMRESDAVERLKRVLEKKEPFGPGIEWDEPVLGWTPWFPVIDRSRCQGCRRCVEYCLFGVYGLSPEGRVMVQTPASCKTGCPACARMCPQKAIVFPKCPEIPIDGSEIPESQDLQVSAAPANGELRQALKGRYGSRAKRLLKQDLVRSRLEIPEGPEGK